MNPEIDDGGPAFPAGPFGDTMHGEDGRVSHQYPATEGMSLRDWFAGNATDKDVNEYIYDDWGNPKKPPVSREQARYIFADNMITQRTAHLKSPN